MDEEEIKKKVRQGYANVVTTKTSCCGPPQTSCCGPVQQPCCGTPVSDADIIKAISKNIGYSDDEIDGVPEGANLGLGCGNPVALASLKEGETVLDLGSGAGFDCFLASKRVGPSGKVIGVDMTPEMLSQARKNAREGNFTNVEFRLGEIEHLPVDANSIDVIISNCVINLVPNKARAFEEAFRVLKPGGRLMVSDIVLLKKLPEVILNSMEAYISCVSGAILEDEYVQAMGDAGFQDIKILEQTGFPIDVVTINPKTMELVKQMGVPLDDLKDFTGSVVSIKVEAKKI
jgi:SAM-dependent methyltransferase